MATSTSEAERSIVPPGAHLVRPPRIEDYAIVIGINDYPKFRGLRGAVRDAIKVAAWLRHPRCGDVAKRRLRLITSTPAPAPVHSDIDDALEQLLADADARGGGRRLYFYFAGHGAMAIEAAHNVALLLADWRASRARQCLSSRGYADDIIRFGLFDELVVLLDCCRSNSGTGVGLSCLLSPEFKTRSIPNTRQFIAYATEAGGVSFEDSHHGLWQGVFTRCLLRLLRRSPGIAALDLSRLLPLEVAAMQPGQRARVVNELESARFGVAPGPDLIVEFSAGRIGPMQLSDGSLAPIGTWDPAHGPWRVPLRSGLYKLSDATGTFRYVEFPRESYVVF